MKTNKRWRVMEQAKLLQQLGDFLNRGYHLTTAIEFLMLYENDGKSKDLKTVIEKLKQGITLSEALHSIHYAKEGLSYIYFAEQYGVLSEGLEQAGKILEMKETYKKDLIKVLRYPLFLCVSLILIVIIFQNILLPQFIQLYQSMNLPQSNIVTFAVSIQNTLPRMLWLFLVALILLLILFRYFLRKKSPIELHIFICKFPLIRYFVKKYNTYFFALHFGNLLDNGLSINEVLTILEDQAHVVFFRDEAKRIRRQLLEGEQLENILRYTTYYDNELSAVIVHGQANGILASELLDYSRLIIEEFETKFTWWIRIIQPTIMVGVGLFVIALYVIVMFPIYGMMQSL